MTTVSARTLGWSLAALLLLSPALGMIFSNDVNWGHGDFVAAALLLGVAGLGLEPATRTPARTRWFAAAAVLGAALLIWVELAVGIIGPA
jgi:hypothetical protein